MAKLNRIELARIWAARCGLLAYAEELREKSVGMDDSDLRATQLQDQADGMEELAAELDEMHHGAS